MEKHVIYDSENDDSDIYFEDEKINLYKHLPNKILVIANLGLWNGRKSGYKIIQNTNLNSVLMCAQGDCYKVYTDETDVCVQDIHHDGTNYYTFRLIKDEDNIDELTDMIYNGDFGTQDIDKYTESLLPYVNEIYGWKD